MRACLFEDRGVLNLEPLSLTRPAFELLCGLNSLAAKQSRYFPPGPRGMLVRPHLANLCRLHFPSVPVNDLDWLREGPTILINGRWLPPCIPVPLADLSHPCVALIQDEVAYAVVEPEQMADCSTNTFDDCLTHWKNVLPRRAADGRLIHYPWELVENNAEQIVADWQTAGPPFVLQCSPVERPGFTILGPYANVLIHPSVHLDPMIVADAS